MANGPTKYWIIVAAHDHVQKGIEGGFAQANHGKASNLNRMKKGDGIVFYSPKEKLGDTKPLQTFTAIGRVNDDTVYQVTMSPDFEPFRRHIHFAQSHEAPIDPLIDSLTFIQNKARWGMAFRFGFLEIPEADFARIAEQMTDPPHRV